MLPHEKQRGDSHSRALFPAASLIFSKNLQLRVDGNRLRAPEKRKTMRVPGSGPSPRAGEIASGPIAAIGRFVALTLRPSADRIPTGE